MTARTDQRSAPLGAGGLSRLREMEETGVHPLDLLGLACQIARSSGFTWCTTLNGRAEKVARVWRAAGLEARVEQRFGGFYLLLTAPPGKKVRDGLEVAFGQPRPSLAIPALRAFVAGEVEADDAA